MKTCGAKECNISITKTYEKQARDFEHPGTTEAVLMTGLSSEVGEVLAEWLKEQRLDRPDTDRTEEILDELSDVLWYVSRIANRRGSSLEELMIHNNNKLQDRKTNGK